MNNPGGRAASKDWARKHLERLIDGSKHLNHVQLRMVLDALGLREVPKRGEK